MTKDGPQVAVFPVSYLGFTGVQCDWNYFSCQFRPWGVDGVAQNPMPDSTAYFVLSSTFSSAWARLMYRPVMYGVFADRDSSIPMASMKRCARYDCDRCSAPLVASRCIDHLKSRLKVELPAMRAVGRACGSTLPPAYPLSCSHALLGARRSVPRLQFVE